MGRTKAEIPFMAILKAQQLRPVLIPASGFLPQFGGLDAGHQDFLCPGLIHFLPDDGLYLAQDTQAEGKPGIDTGGELADHAGA